MRATFLLSWPSVLPAVTTPCLITVPTTLGAVCRLDPPESRMTNYSFTNAYQGNVLREQTVNDDLVSQQYPRVSIFI